MTYLPRYEDNKIYDCQFDETASTEYLTLNELKAHLQITYTDDDTYLTALIKACRAALEQYCNISLVSKVVTLFADLYCEREIPYGPVSTFTSASLKTSAGTYTAQTLNTDFEVDGITNGFQVFKPFISGRWKLIYTAGYAAANVPKDLILATKHEAAFRYEHRGDETNQYANENVGLCQSAVELASKHKRLNWV